MSAVEKILDRYDLPVRIAFFIVMIALSVAFLLIGSKAALAMGLKSESTVTSESIHLGDIFYGLPGNEDKVLGPAPQPGKEMVLNARTLMRIATTLDLPWRPATSADQVVLRSAATVIDQKDIESKLDEALKEKGVQGLFNVSFGGIVPTIVLPQDEPGTFDIGALNYDPKNGQFSATLFAPSMDKPIQKVSVTGKVEGMAEIPVLTDSLRAGDVISKNDIDHIQIPRREIGAKTAIRDEDLIGSTPRRIINAGVPVEMTEIESPRLVTRGDMVTMVFREGSLLLTAKGRALEHGAKGDTINIVNANSSRTVQGIVSGDKEVTLEAF